MSALCEHLLQGLCLRYGAGESVEYHALMLLAEAVVHACEDAYHKLIGYELAVVDVSLGGLAQLGAVLYLGTQHVARGDMVEPVLLDHQIALCALA